MRLPFLSSKAYNGKAEGLLEKRRKASADEEEADEAPRWKKTVTGKKAIAKAERKQAKKKAAWEREQERRRLHALARWEYALRSEPQAAQSTEAAAGEAVVVPGTVLSANGRLEYSRRSQARRSRRYLDVDHLDEVSDTDESDQSDDGAGNNNKLKDDGPSVAEKSAMMSGNLAAGPVFQLGSSAAAQLHQVAAMRELPMLERCATRQAPSSFFVDMLLLGDSSSAAPRTRRGRAANTTTNEDEEEEEEATCARHRRAADKKRATRSCPTGRAPHKPSSRV